jgi:hypothetical protein
MMASGKLWMATEDFISKRSLVARYGGWLWEGRRLSRVGGIFKFLFFSLQI